MKAYLVTTAVVFGLLVVVHAWRLIAEGWGVLRDPFYDVATLAALGLVLWAVRLLVRTTRTGR